MNNILIIIFCVSIKIFSTHSQEFPTVCDTSERYGDYLRICTTRNLLLSVQETNHHHFNGEIRINYRNINEISRNAFKNMTIKKLILNLGWPHETLNITTESFNGLSFLNFLEIRIASVSLKQNLFKSLKSLNHLGLRVKEIPDNLNSVFLDLKNLTSLRIYESYFLNITRKEFYNFHPAIEILELAYNTIHFIEKKSFETLESLTKLVIIWNGLLSLEPETFYGLNKLEKLDLSCNEIKKIFNNTFNNLKKLDTLILDYNKITDIHIDSFKGIDLRELSLRSNEIEYLKPGIFDGLKNLMYLSLSGNKLKFVPKNLFSKLRLLKGLYLRSNRIKMIEESPFFGMNLASLWLNDNILSVIEASDFQGLETHTLDLSNNKIREIQRGAFNNSTVGALIMDNNELKENKCVDFKNEYGLLNTTDIIWYID